MSNEKANTKKTQIKDTIKECKAFLSYLIMSSSVVPLFVFSSVRQTGARQCALLFLNRITLSKCARAGSHASLKHKEPIPRLDLHLGCLWKKAADARIDRPCCIQKKTCDFINENDRVKKPKSASYARYSSLRCFYINIVFTLLMSD